MKEHNDSISSCRNSSSSSECLNMVAVVVVAVVGVHIQTY